MLCTPRSPENEHAEQLRLAVATADHRPMPRALSGRLRRVGYAFPEHSPDLRPGVPPAPSGAVWRHLLRRLTMRLTVRIVLPILVLAAALPFAVMAIRGRSLLYRPTQLGQSDLQALAARPGWRLDPLRVAPDTLLNGLVRPPAVAGSPWLILFGGNSMDLRSGQSILELLADGADWGVAVWAYRGYDGSDGSPTEERLCADADAQIAHLEEAYGVEPRSLVIMGQSLGSGVAAHAAASLHESGTRPAALVLVSAYTSIARVVDEQTPIVPLGWAMPDSFRTDRLLDRIPGPVLLIHGVTDGIITIDHGEELASRLGERAELYRVAGVGHVGFWQDDSVVDKVRVFLSAHTTGHPGTAAEH